MTSPPIPIHCSAAMPLPPMSSGIWPVVTEVEVNAGADQDATTVRATVVQACSMFYETPAPFDKAAKLTADAARYGSQLVLFPEVFVGGYPHGSAFGLTIVSRSAKGKEDFWKYHVAAIDVPEHTAVCPGGSSIRHLGQCWQAPSMKARPSSQLTWTLVKLFRRSLISTLWDTTHGLRC